MSDKIGYIHFAILKLLLDRKKQMSLTAIANSLLGYTDNQLQKAIDELETWHMVKAQRGNRQKEYVPTTVGFIAWDQYTEPPRGENMW